MLSLYLAVCKYSAVASPIPDAPPVIKIVLFLGGLVVSGVKA